jgi:hypothetical protein
VSPSFRRSSDWLRQVAVARHDAGRSSTGELDARVLQVAAASPSTVTRNCLLCRVCSAARSLPQPLGIPSRLEPPPLHRARPLRHSSLSRT